MESKQLFYRVFGKYSRQHPFWKNKMFGNNQFVKTESLCQRHMNMRKNSVRGKFLYDEILSLYSSGYGLKYLAKKYATTYTKIRKYFSFYKIEIRHGHNIVTDKLREFRAIKAKNEKINRNGFFDPDIRRHIAEYNNRGVNYWYYNKFLDENVWLRSTYEYIFAKWLDRTNQKWNVEVTYYKMKDGRIYRPDFFLYDENNNINKIVEIKGYWDNNSDKAELLNHDLENIDVAIIFDITKFIEEGSTYLKELNKWKKIKESKIYG